MKKYLNSSQGQRSRSNVTDFQSLLAFTVGHTSTKLHQFLISSFRDFVWTDRCTDRQMPPKTIPARSIAGMQVLYSLLVLVYTLISYEQILQNITAIVRKNYICNCIHRNWHHTNVTVVTQQVGLCTVTILYGKSVLKKNSSCT